MGFPRQEYWSGLPFPPMGYLHDSGIEPMYPASFTLAGRLFTMALPGKPDLNLNQQYFNKIVFFLNLMNTYYVLKFFLRHLVI